MRAWGKGAAVAGWGIVVAGCSLFPGGQPDAGETEQSSHTVVLEVAASDADEVDLSYTAGDAQQEEEQGVELPWQQTRTVTDLDSVSVVAHGTGASGELTCTITVDGQVRDQVSAEGEFALVACDLATAAAPTPTAG